MRVAIEIPDEFIPALAAAAELSEWSIENFIVRSAAEMARATLGGVDKPSEEQNRMFDVLDKRLDLFEAKVGFEGRKADSGN